MNLVCLPLGTFRGGVASAAYYVIPGAEVTVERFPDCGLGRFGLVGIVDGIDGRSIAGGVGRSVQCLVPGGLQAEMPVFSFNTAPHKGDRFAFRLFCRVMAAVNVVLPVNGFDSGAIAQGLFDPQGCVGKGRGRAGATRAAHLPFQVFATSVRLVEPSGVPVQVDVAWLVCRVRPIDPHASPARYLSARLVPSLGNDWILATVQHGATSCVRCRRCRVRANTRTPPPR